MSLIIRTDVTSVKFYKNLVLSGIGSFVSVFEKSSLKFLYRIHALKGQKVYGIVPSGLSDKILVYGGKQFTVISIESSIISCEDTCGDEIKDVVSNLMEPVVCDDWIHSGIWHDDVTVALLTAHNEVQKWDITKQALLSRHQSRDNSILYSGLLLGLRDDVLVFAGTVFSEVIIHRCGDDKPLHHLKGHRGVIFSISCDPQKEIIVTTSDDRSVRIWGLNNIGDHAHNTTDFWKNLDIVCNHKLYGHTARVMRSCITNTNIVSVGEDSAICYWDLEGKLLRKILSHQNGCIWSVDNDNDHLVTGGGDCGIILHPLTVATDYGQNEVLKLDAGSPKNIVFTARRNAVIINDDSMIYYDVEEKSTMTYELNHESTYKLLSISSCKQIVAVVDMSGKLDVFIENCKGTAYMHIIDTKLYIGRILSMQWAGNRHLVFCSENGGIEVLASKGNKTELYDNFLLPYCKERWLTASAIDSVKNILVLGDRCGNIHIYVKGQRQPIKTFNKVHGRYGPTSITVRNNEIVTTGRDGTVKYFSINNDTLEINYMNSRELGFQWAEKFLDKNENIICGFQERVFVVYDMRANSKLLEVNCGGGHRSWDAIRYIDKINNQYEETVRLIYTKQSDIHQATFQLSKIVSKCVVNGSHSKEINCLKTYKTKSKTFYFSGGEDTTLRISSIDSKLQFKQEAVFKQLSSIRTLRIYPLGNSEVLIVSAGGRAQICVKIVTFQDTNDELKLSSQEVVDYLIKGTDKERKGNQTWRNCSIDFDPETRIMDLDVIKETDKDFIVFAGCSDARLRIFRYTSDSNKVHFEPIKELENHKTCILKVHSFKFLNQNILVTCSTRGEVTFWDMTDTKEVKTEPFFGTTTNKSGINSFASRILSNTTILIATGGDDNTIHLNVLEIPNKDNLESIIISHTWSKDNLHSSQVTGLCLIDDFLISASIDQRVSVSEWNISQEGIRCELVKQVFSDIADIQGMDVIESTSDSVTVCVFGKGFEVIRIPRRCNLE